MPTCREFTELLLCLMMLANLLSPCAPQKISTSTPGRTSLNRHINDVSISRYSVGISLETGFVETDCPVAGTWVGRMMNNTKVKITVERWKI